MSKFCVLRAILKSTILKKRSFLESMIFNVKFFLKNMILNEKLFVKSIKAWFWIETFSSGQISNQLFYSTWDFEFEIFHSVRFWIEICTKFQILNQLIKHGSGFRELNVLQRVRFWVYFFCSLPSFHGFIITGHVSVIRQPIRPEFVHQYT